jgi:siroheme synthase-like protein
LTRLEGLRCVVVGGGQVAERKVEALLDTGARIEVISPSASAALVQWAAAGRITHIPRRFDDADVSGAFMVIAATNDRSTNEAVAWAGRQRNILVNVADDPKAGNFHTAAAVRQGDLLLAVSTGGASPAVAALVRRKLEAVFGHEYAELLAILGALRSRVTREVPEVERPKLWRQLASDEMLEWLRKGDGTRAMERAEELLAAVRHSRSDEANVATAGLSS